MGFATYVELKPKDVKTTYSTKQYPLGTRGMTTDGRVYRFAYAGGTIYAGRPLQPAAATLLDTSSGYTAPINDTEEVGTTWRSFTVETETATGEISANEFSDGFVRVASSTGSYVDAQVLRIKSNDASATSATDALGTTMTITIADDDAIDVALTTGAVTTLHHNHWYGLTHGYGAVACVGVANCTVASGTYFWAQTWGACAVKVDGTATIAGADVVMSTDSTSTGVSVVGIRTSTNSTFLSAGDTDCDAGIGFIHAVAAQRQKIGWAIIGGGTDNDAGFIFLTITP
jgi:hypothetical protein